MAIVMYDEAYPASELAARATFPLETLQDLITFVPPSGYHLIKVPSHDFPLVYMSDVAKTAHDGVRTFDPLVDLSSWGSDLAAYSSANIGNGVYVMEGSYLTPKMGGVAGDFNPGTQIGSDDTIAFQSVINVMNTYKLPIIGSSTMKATNVQSIGFTDISGDIHIHQDNASGRGFEVSIPSTNIGTYSVATNVEFPAGGIEVTKLTGTFTCSVGDVVQVVDGAVIAGTSNVNFSETVIVLGVDGTGVWLDCKLRHFDYYTTGILYKMGSDTISIKGLKFFGTDSAFAGSVNRFNAITVQGAINPHVDVSISNDIGAGLIVRGCYKGSYNVYANNLRDDHTLNSYGYGMAAYGNCKSIVANINATHVRHAYTDGIWDSGVTTSAEKGVVLDSVVRGIGTSCTLSTWDTHAYSDGVMFDVVAREGSSNSDGTTDGAYAVQLRGTNATVKCVTDRRSSLYYDTPTTNLIPSVDHVEIIESETKAFSNTITFVENNPVIPCSLNIRNSSLRGFIFTSAIANIDYITISNSVIDLLDNGIATGSTKPLGLTLRDVEIKNKTGVFRLEAGVFVFDNVTLSTTTVGALIGISVYDGVTLIANNVGYNCVDAAGRAVIYMDAAASASTIIRHSNLWLNQSSGNTSINAIKTNGAVPTITDINATTTVV